MKIHELFLKPVERPIDGVIKADDDRNLRTELDEYRVQSRGGIGIINIQTSDRNGKVVGIAQVSDDDELMLITQQGKILRMASKDIRTIGRATQGVRLIDIEGDDRAVSIARLAESDEEIPEKDDEDVAGNNEEE